MSLTKVPTEPIRVAFQGEPGAFSEEAALRLLGPGAVPVPCSTFDSLFSAIGEAAADCILAPIENTLAGTIAPVCDLLWDCNLTIRAEIIHPIRHCLIGATGATLQTIRTVQSHPAALAQCENYFRQHPHVRRVSTEDTAGSVREVAQAGDLTRAAIAGARAAEIYGGSILLQGLEDNPHNFTRFLLLQNATGRTAAPVGREQKMTLMLHLRHQPGSLHRALGAFARRNLSLLKIESRPIIGQPWHYRFLLDVAAPADSAMAESALDELRAETDEVRYLGTYSVAATPEAIPLRTGTNAAAGGAR